MRIHLCCVVPGVKRRKNRRAPAPKNLAANVRGSRQKPACLNDIRSPARRLTRVDAHRFLGCESELRIGS